MDSLIDNWGVSEKGEVLFLDTFHPPEIMPSKFKTHKSFELKYNAERFLSSAGFFYKPKQYEKLVNAFLKEIRKTYGERKAKEVESYCRKRIKETVIKL